MSVTLTPPERVKFKACLVEITNSMARMDAEKEAKKEITDRVKEEFGIKPSQANKLARVMYKMNYGDLQQEQEDFEYLYETIVEGKTTTEDDSE